MEQLEQRALLAGIPDAIADQGHSPIDSDLREAINQVAAARGSGWKDSAPSSFIYNGDGIKGVPLSVSATGQILAMAEFAPGDTTIVDAMRARGLNVGRSFAANGDAEVWVDASSAQMLAGIPGLFSVDLPEMAAFTNAGSYVSETAGYGPLASNSSDGKLTTRTSDTAGQITISNVNGVTTSNLIDIYWSGGRRTGVSVTGTTPSGSNTIVTFSGGSGDILPSSNSTITIDSSLKIQRVLDQFRAAGLSGTAIDGTGIKIGVLSSGDYGLTGAEASGDLPASVTVGSSLDTTDGEGTAMMEIIHDIAPGAQLYFYGVFGGTNPSADFQTGVQWMQNTAHVNVIVDDISFPAEPYFTDGPIAQSVQGALNAGIRYVTSAGNYNLQHYQWFETVAAGSYFNFNPNGTADLDLEVQVPANVDPSHLYRLDPLLQWSDQWGGRTNNVTLELWNNRGGMMLASNTSTSIYPFDDAVWYNGAAASPRAGNTTSGSTTISNLPSTSDLVTGMVVGGSGIPTGATITSISPTSIVISSAATSSITGVTITFGAASRTGNVTSGSQTISGLSKTSDLKAGMTIGGTGIPYGATIFSVVNGTTITISDPATSTGTGRTLTFGVATTVRLKIKNTNVSSSMSRNFEVFALGTGGNGPTQINEPTYQANYSGDALIAQEALPGVITVGAIAAQNGVPTGNQGNNTIESFSSHGSSTIITDVNSQSNDGRYTLDVVGIDGVDTWVGHNGAPDIPAQFYGTSAAAPGVAGIVALMLNAAGSGSTADVTGAMTRSGSTTLNSTTISISSLYNTSDLAVGMSVSGSGVPAGSRITSINSSTSISISNPATASAFVFLNFGALSTTAADLGSGLYENTYGNGRVNALDAVYGTFKPPTGPVLSNDDGLFTTDGVTDNTTPTFTGTAPAGSYVALFDGGVQVGTPVQLGPAVTTYNLTGPTVAANTTHSYTVRVKSSSSSALYSQDSPSTTVYFDSLASSTPSSPFMDHSSSIDTGVSQTDGYTTNTNPKIDGSTTAFANVAIYVDGTLAATGSADSSGNYSINTGTLAYGWHSVAVETKMNAGAPWSSYHQAAMPQIYIDDGTAPTVSLSSVSPTLYQPISSTLGATFNKPVTWNQLSDIVLVRKDASSVGSGSISTTQFSADSTDVHKDLTTTDHYYKGRTLTFTSGALSGQSGVISDYTGASRTFTFATGFSSAPSAGDTFHIEIPVARTGNTTSGSTTISGLSVTTDDLQPGMAISGPGIPQTATISTIVSSTSITISSAATATATGVGLTYENRFPFAQGAAGWTPHVVAQSTMGFFSIDITMGAGDYALSFVNGNSGTDVVSAASGVAAPSSAGPSTWSQQNAPYQNGGPADGPGGRPGAYYDTDGDGYIAPSDILKITNDINAYGSQQLPGTVSDPYYDDVNGDGYLAPIDELIIINYINAGYGTSPPGFAPIRTGGQTPPANLQPTDVVANVQLQVTDLNGAPIASIRVGQQFQLRALLVLTAPAGVQPVSGYADVSYAATLVAPASNPNDVGLVGSTASGGLVDEAGRAMYGDSTGLMFTQTFTATKKGTASFSASPADLFGHEIYVTGLNGALPWSQVTFSSTQLTIK